MTRAISDKGTSREPDKCATCRQREPDILFVPCGHRVVCKSCCGNLSLCPHCSSQVKVKFDKSKTKHQHPVDWNFSIWDNSTFFQKSSYLLFQKYIFNCRYQNIKTNFYNCLYKDIYCYFSAFFQMGTNVKEMCSKLRAENLGCVDKVCYYLESGRTIKWNGLIQKKKKPHLQSGSQLLD